jgi:hypothetical protein
MADKGNGNIKGVSAVTMHPCIYASMPPKESFMKKNIAALCFILLAALCAAFYFLTDYLIKDKSDSLENLIVEKTRAAARTSLMDINKSIENSDDISLLSNIDNLAKLEGIDSCFILDADNKTIIHNNTYDWNQTRKSPEYDRAISYRVGELVQAAPGKDRLLFSAPLIKDRTLFCIISIEKAQDTLKIGKIKDYGAAALTAFVITFIVYIFAKLFILFPFNRTKKRLEAATAENTKNEKYDEISDMFLSERKKYEEKIFALKENGENMSKIIRRFLSGYEKDYEAAIALNESNNIIYAYDKTQAILKDDFVLGNNIIESLLNPDLLKIISKAAETPNTEITAEDGTVKINVVSVSYGENASGTIITANKIR